MPYTDNPLADFHAHDDECERRMLDLPRCDYCKNRVTDDFYYEIDGEILCEDCMNDNYRKRVDDYEA